MEAKLVIKRPKRFRGSATKYVVYIDGAAVGKIGNGAELVFAIADGTHNISVGIKSVFEDVRTPPINVEADCGRTVELICGVTSKGGLFLARTEGGKEVGRVESSLRLDKDKAVLYIVAGAAWLLGSAAVALTTDFSKLAVGLALIGLAWIAYGAYQYNKATSASSAAPAAPAPPVAAAPAWTPPPVAAAPAWTPPPVAPTPTWTPPPVAPTPTWTPPPVAPTPTWTPPPAAAPVWAPTHLVPDIGMAFWAQPNSLHPPVGRLPANLGVAVETSNGDWAQVRAANGWCGWVNGRLLVRTRA